MNGRRGSSVTATRSQRHRRRAAAAVVCLGLVAAGCGEDASTTTDDPEVTDASTPSGDPTTAEASPTSAAGPACDDIWQAGLTLPRGYDGCVDAEGAPVPAERVRCSSGQHYVTYADRFYAVPGAEVQEADGSLADDPTYQAIRNRCRG